MIHIATVHWNTSRWIDIQLAYLTKYIKSEFRVYAFLNGIGPEHVKKFFYASTEPIEEHAIKLNILADIIKFSANSSDDMIIFLDGDAFPVNDLEPFMYEKIKQHQLVAIQRKESNGDMQPHPSFCATTIQFWNEIKGDWKRGYNWIDNQGESIGDVGGNVLENLIEKDINWLPLLRTNKKDYHPLWFGVYENLVYHHGAGFRDPFDRVDVTNANFKLWLTRKIYRKASWLQLFFEKKFQKGLSNVIANNKSMDHKVYNNIINDPYFFKEFIG